MVGKDMTRMTLPVSFNEPTSLLQRLAEDIEYNSLLNTAAGYDDSTLRLIYVATFAATEYSSTIDRIAKPFNPLLGKLLSIPDLTKTLDYLWNRLVIILRLVLVEQSLPNGTTTEKMQ